MIKNKNILIFGKRGFIGSHFYNTIKKNNNVYSFFSNNKKIDLNNYHKKKIDYIINKNKFDFILNFHAQTDLKFSNKNPNYDFYHNCSIVHSIVNAMINNSCKAFFLNFGTVTQIGYTNIKKKIKLNITSKPQSIFDLHKQYSENYISIQKTENNLNATTLRLSNVFGLGKTYSKNRGVISQIIDNALLNKKIILFGNGNYVRDFIYINDVIKGIILALKNHNNLKDNYYYLTSGRGNTFNQLAKFIKQEIYMRYKFKVNIEYKSWPKNSSMLDKRSFIGNPQSFIKATGWKSSFVLKDSISHYIDKKNN